MARTVEIFTYANVTDLDYTNGPDNVWVCAEVRDGGVLAANVPVLFDWLDSPYLFDTTVNTSGPGSSTSGPTGIAFIGYLWGSFNPATHTAHVRASVNSGSIVDGPLAITWHHAPDVGGADYSSPPPDLAAADAGSNTVDLDWTAVPSADTSGHFTEVIYTLERALAPGGPWTNVTLADPHLLTKTDGPLADGTYYYRVLGKERWIGWGTYSDIVSVTLGLEPPVTTLAAWGVLAR